MGLLLRVACAAVAAIASTHASGTRYLLDADWRFQRGGVSPAGGALCTDPRCLPATDDSSWRALDLPHDYAVEGNFSESADKGHGYLPLVNASYRKHIAVPPLAAGAAVWLEFDGIQSSSTVWWNGVLLGSHASGYTPSRYFLNASSVIVAGDNVLAVWVETSVSAGSTWWYDGSGMYRHAWLCVTSAPVFIGPDGVYAPSAVTGAISWPSKTAGPIGDAVLVPTVEVWSNETQPRPFNVSLRVLDPAGMEVAAQTGGGTALAAGVTHWSSPNVSLPAAQLWHLVPPPLSPALYTLETNLSMDGVVVDTVTVTFGVRQTDWRHDSGFWLNGVNTKILGTANHQDYAAVGVGVPDALQRNRVSVLKSFGVNGWRTAHNPPTPALLDATDRLGLLVWDENHLNGALDDATALVRRDRNRPSVVIWSICNERLCKTRDTNGDALAVKAAMHAADPFPAFGAGGRPVSANYNDPWSGNPKTPLDVQGFDYSTDMYDTWWAAVPGKACISSETASAVSDRSELLTNVSAGRINCYDNAPGGNTQTTEQAWGGVGVTAGQGILTRPFMAGGWTWTGWDYRGEPTPLSYPDVNSHYGLVDNAGFTKERAHWYAAWFLAVAATSAAATEGGGGGSEGEGAVEAGAPPYLFLFPPWSGYAPETPVNVWAHTTADVVELFVNGVSAGRSAVPRFTHAAWNAVPFVPGSICAVAYVNGSTSPAASICVNTTGQPAALRISIKDGIGAPALLAGCADAALVQVAVVDAGGSIVPYAELPVTFSLSGPAALAGTANGDPASLEANTGATRPAFHGLVLAVVRGGTVEGNVTITAAAPGLAPVSLVLPQVAAGTAPAVPPPWWCRTEPRL